MFEFCRKMFDSVMMLISLSFLSELKSKAQVIFLMQTLKITFILMIKFYPKSYEPLNFLEW